MNRIPCEDTYRVKHGAFLLMIVVVAVFGSALLGRVPSAAQPAPTPTPFKQPFGPVTEGNTPTPEPIQIVITATPLPPTPTPELPTATPTPALPALRTEMMGIQAYANVEVDAWFQLVDRVWFMGFGWIKVQINWKEMEPQPGQFSPVFTVVRDNLIYAGRRGFKIMLSIVNAPDWARPPEARGQLEGPPADPATYANFIGTIMDTWDRQYIQAVELWNEPNLIREWTGAPRTGANYKRIFDAGYNAIRARSAEIVVLTAGTAPAGDTPDGSVDDRRWLRELYAAGLPIGDPNFGIGIHPYGWSNAPDARCCAVPSIGWDDQPYFFFLDNIATYRQIMLENGHANGKLWATEFGWATFQGLRYRDHIRGPAAIPPSEPGLGWMNRITEEQQAQYIVRAFELAQNGELAGFMGPMILWNLNFASLPGYVREGEPSLPEAGYSVLNSDWGTRPAFHYLSNAPRR